MENIENLKKELGLARNELLLQYYTDNLTSLPNLYKLRYDIEESLDFTLIVLNIDNFKILNDFYGFIVGDFILEAVGKKLNGALENEKIYRIASDEFAILLDERLKFYELKRYLVNLVARFSHLSFAYAETKIFVDLTFASASTTSIDNIFSKVNMALKYAKEKLLKFWIYEDDMDMGDEYEKNLKFAIKIREALNNSRLIPYFQPILDNKTNKIVKYEALSRLMDSEGLIHAPQSFIPAAKKIKVYDKITKIVIAKTFDMFRDINLEFSINLSFEDIINQDIYNFILEMLKDTKMGNRVTFELLESEKVDDFEKVLHFFSEIKRYGGKIAIDDFGSGFSNFSYLTRIKPDFIKIDGSLIKNIDIDKNSYIVVETIVDFAKKMGIETVAEYVHSSTVLSTVKSMGIDYSQGFFIDKPTPIIEMQTHYA